MRISFTHIFDLAHKLVTIVGVFTLLAIGFDLLSPAGDFLAAYLPGWLFAILIFASFIGGLGLSAFILEKTILPYWISTYLYGRLFLGVTFKPSEAERVGFLFDGSLGGVWYSFKSLRKIDKEYRKEVLFRFANSIATEKKWAHPFVMPEDELSSHKVKQQGQKKSDQSQSSTSKPYLDNQVQAALEILGLDEQPDSFALIKKAYRRKISEFHPDKFVGERPEVIRYAEETSKKLNIAYNFLEESYVKANEAN